MAEVDFNKGKLGSGIFLGGVCFFLLVFFAYQLGGAIIDYRAMRHWPQVEATIIDMDLYGTRKPVLYMAYRFEAGGRVCENSRVNILKNAGRNHHERFVGSYRAKQPIQVWADPSGSCRAVADRNFPGFEAVIAVIFGFPALLILLLYLPRKGWRVP